MKKYKLDVTYINENGKQEFERFVDVVCFNYKTLFNELEIYSSMKSWYKQILDKTYKGIIEFGMFRE